MLPLRGALHFAVRVLPCYLSSAEFSGHFQLADAGDAERTVLSGGEIYDVRPVIHIALTAVVAARGCAQVGFLPFEELPREGLLQ